MFLFLCVIMFSVFFIEILRIFICEVAIVIILKKTGIPEKKRPSDSFKSSDRPKIDLVKHKDDKQNKN